ncbi:MAG: hypothetical protein H0T72_02210 [Chloroflexia bacterium]|nr:hypothetical protein [Chloroflexia bacterium]
MARPPITLARPYTPSSGVVAGITFTSERQYRNALARAKGFQSWSQQQKQARKVSSGADVAKLRPDERKARKRALDALSRMRSEGLSLKDAAKASGTTVNAVKRHAGPALQLTGGRYQAKASDRLSRTLQFPTETGAIGLDVRDSRSARRIAEYWNAVKRYTEHGDASGLRKFRGKSVRVKKRAYPFITDLDMLDRLADAGELGFDDLYDYEEAA